MALHEAAQSLWWFVVIVIVAIAVVLFIDYRKELKNVRKK